MVITQNEKHSSTNIPLYSLHHSMAKSKMGKVADIFDLYLPHSYTKDRSAAYLSSYILQHPDVVLGALSASDLNLVQEFVAAGPNACVERKMLKRPNKLQKTGLVLTYEDLARDTWKMFMPDELRKVFAPLIAQEIINRKEEKEILKELKTKEEQLLAHFAEQQQPVALHLQNELTIKVSLDGLPIYRTIQILDSTSFHELYAIITLLFEWDQIKLYAFSFIRDGKRIPLSNRTVLYYLALQPGEEMSFYYDCEGDNWKHTLRIEKSEPCAIPPNDYNPTFIEGCCSAPGESSGGNARIKAQWDELHLEDTPPSKTVLDDCIQFYWKMRGI